MQRLGEGGRQVTTNIRRTLDKAYNLYKYNAKEQRFVHMDEVLAILKTLKEALDLDEGLETEEALKNELDNILRDGGRVRKWRSW